MAARALRWVLTCTAVFLTAISASAAPPHEHRLAFVVKD